MKRPQSQLPQAVLGVSLASLQCRRCQRFGCDIVALEREARGGGGYAWCGPGCAMLDGWPFLRSEQRRKPLAAAPAGVGGHA